MYDGRPPARSGIIAASSERSRHRIQPQAVISTITGIAAAPSATTIVGPIPVTRIVPARPITNALHQLPVFGIPACS